VNQINPTVIVLLVAACGALARTLVPFLQALQENPDTVFDRKFLLPPIVSCIIALLTLPISLAALPPELLQPSALSLSLLVAVFVAVWGVTDIARVFQKMALGK
jgi:hypothetical protein